MKGENGAAKRSPLVAMIGGLFLFVIIIPLIRTGCYQISDRYRQKKRDKVKVSLNERVPVEMDYSIGAGTGGDYRDPIHKFFEFQTPSGASVDANYEERTMKLPSDSPYSGEEVLCTRVHIQLDRDTDVSIRARESYLSTVDAKELKSSINKFGKGTFGDTRWITIDGVVGVEVIGKVSKKLVHVVKYKKYGLDHTIVFTCLWKKFSEPQKKFIKFLHSYRGLNPE
jgi:hypothetical protein